MTKADMIIKGGTFYCGRDLDNDIDFVAIKGNRILATGKEDEMPQFIDENTEVFEFTKENLITAGLHDNHIHLIQSGMMCRFVELFECKSPDECGQVLADCAMADPDAEWIMGFGFMRRCWEDHSLPTADILDRYIPDRPVLAFDDEMHSGWVNSKAMEICGITKDTPDPENGSLARYDDGTPIGFLIDDGLALAGKVALDFPHELTKDIINSYADFAVSMGITSVSDMAPYLTMDLSYPEAHYDMAQKGESKIRVNAARDLFEAPEVYEKYIAEAEEKGKGFYRVCYLKQFVDGTPANYTGWLLEDYSDKPGEKGAPTLDVEKMKEAVMMATERGVSVRLHSCGDASCRAALDAYEAGYKAFPDSESRHMIEHLEVVHPDDLGRLGELGVIASVQPEHYCTWPVTSDEEDYNTLLGERYYYASPFRTFRDTGAMLAAGSDCPVVNGNPYYGIFGGLTRLFADMKMAEGANPNQTLEIEDLLDMYTIGGAFCEKREDELGTIEPGKLADITVIDRNLIELASSDPVAIRDAKATLTMVDGRVVYRA